MKEDDEITEIKELEATRLSGVTAGANGTPWILLKAQAPKEGDADDSDDSKEADEIENLLTKTLTEQVALIGDYARAGVMSTAELDALREIVEKADPEALEKAKLDAKRRHALPDSAFAYIDSKGGRHLPIPDAAHVRNALARFNQTHFESEEAKKKAARKIIARAKELGIATNPKDEVAELAKGDEGVEKSPGVPANATQLPKKAKKIKNSGKSKAAGPMTAGVRSEHGDPTWFPGGESTYRIPVDAKVDTDRFIPGHVGRRGMRKEKKGVIEIVRKKKDPTAGTNWLAVENNPSSQAQSSTPGNQAWEHYDASTLDAAARAITAIQQGLDTIRKREITEAVDGQAGDWLDAMKLDCALDDLAHALSIVAALAYHEAAAAQQKGHPELAKALDSTVQRLYESMTKGVSMVLTEAELKKLIQRTAAKKSSKAVAKERKRAAKQAVAKERKRAAKLEKKMNKKLKAMKSRLLPNSANNNGDLSGQELRDGVTAKHDAADISGVPGATNPMTAGETVRKGKKGKALKKELKKLEEMLVKVGSQPQGGGPVLSPTSIPMKVSTTDVTLNLPKEVQDEETLALEKKLAEAKDTEEILALRYQLLSKGLRNAHARGILPTPWANA